MNRELTIVEPTQIATLYGTDDPDQVLAKATAKATVLAKVVKDKGLFTTIQGRDHVQVEGWTFLGSMCGVFPVTVWTRAMSNGWEARVEARTLNGEIVGGAEAECTRDEKTWADRPDYALRSMAQTRATSKALRMPLGYIMTLAGYAATPAEEMTGIHDAPARTASAQAGPGGDHFCQEHKTKWFKAGRMTRYAHKIEGTDKWCNEPEAKPAPAPKPAGEPPEMMAGIYGGVDDQDPLDGAFGPAEHAPGATTPPEKAVSGVALNAECEALIKLLADSHGDVKKFQAWVDRRYGQHDFWKMSAGQRSEVKQILEDKLKEYNAGADRAAEEAANA